MIPRYMFVFLILDKNRKVNNMWYIFELNLAPIYNLNRHDVNKFGFFIGRNLYYDVPQTFLTCSNG